MGLRLAEVPYAAVMRLRNGLYDWSVLGSCRAGVPVVSVGNLTLGGTGKTPMVAWLASWFRRRGAAVAILSRGYRAGSGGQNDEALELAHGLPGVLHLQDPQRVRAARHAVEEHHCQVLLLDDAFQHRRIARDVDIVLLDALEPFGWERVFPRGMLREPLAGLARAQVVALSRADAVDVETREAIARRAGQLAPHALCPNRLPGFPFAGLMQL